MLEQLTNRLAQLKAEYESGEKMLAELDQKQRTLRDTLLRISGAIQVIEEELRKVESSPAEDVIERVGVVGSTIDSGSSGTHLEVRTHDDR
jgi:chromosome segregation ATPase